MVGRCSSIQPVVSPQARGTQGEPPARFTGSLPTRAGAHQLSASAGAEMRGRETQSFLDRASDTHG